MSHYKSNVRDQVFNLFEVFGVDKALGEGEYADLDADTAREMLGEIARLAEGPIAESFADGDRNPPTFDPKTHSVTLPESFKKSVRAMLDGGWDKVGLDEELGGVPMPKALMWALHEHILGANPAVWMYGGGAGFANILYHLGTDEQKKWARSPPSAAGAPPWCSPSPTRVRRRRRPHQGRQAGRRLLAHRRREALHHLGRLRRPVREHLPPGAGPPRGRRPGTKGLSLFFVPKFLFDFETGELGERNGVFVTNVEHKMGLKVSATCELTLGQHDMPAKGWLVGEVHDGIAQMFDVIEQARMMVGTKAIATLSTGYLNALEYAKDRVQGADMTQMTDKTAPRVTITHHPDVRRSLMTQKAYAEGLRALYLYTATYQDAAVAKALHGVDAELAVKVNDLLLPIVKGVGSEQAYAKLTESAADLRWLRLPAGLPDRAVHPRRQDRLAVRGHHGHPGAGLLLPQDRPRQGRGAGARGRADRAVRQERVRQRPAEGRARAAGHRAGGRAGDGGHADRLPDVGAGEPAERLQGRPRFGALPDERRRPGHRLAACSSRPRWRSRQLDAGVSGDDRAFYEGKVAVASFFAKNMLPLLTSTRR